MKFIHCADVHLDTPLQGLAEYPGAPVNEIRSATRRAFEKLLDAALSEEVDFVIIAGDLYDVGLKSFESALFFNKSMLRLKEAGIDVYLIHGNHDAASKLIKHLRPPSNVHVFRSNEPHTFSIEALRVAVHGQSFATPETIEDLAAHYPPRVPDFFNIGVLHTNLSGISDHANYAPCSLETLKNKGYQYWALGHVHNRQVLCTEPYIIYPGNIQGRHGKEQGEKSCELVTVSETGSIRTEIISTSVVPWVEVEVDASDCQNADEVYDSLRVAFGKLLAEGKERITAMRVRTLLRGISALFFGVPVRTPDVHSCKGSELRIGATISEGEKKLSFRRRKGSSGTVLNMEEVQIQDSVLVPFLRELDCERFEQFFGLDHDRLREGGEELLRGQGMLAARSSRRLVCWM
jgi:exonuclease SbcD